MNKLIKIITTGSSEMNLKKYLTNSLKKRKVLSYYKIINVSNSEQIRNELLDANVILTSKWPNKKIKAPKLKLILTPGAGYDGIYLPAVPKGCKVCNVFEHEAPMAEYCLLAMLESEIKLTKMNKNLKIGNWKGYFSSSSFHGELLNKNLAIIGFGHIGTEIAKRAQAFGMNIFAVVRNTKKNKNKSKNFQFIPIKYIEKYLSVFDYLIVSCPLNEQTKNLVSLDFIKKMKKSSVIINIARGPIINEKALYIALNKNLIREAIIDVWYNYPKSNNSKKLWPSKYPIHKLKNITMSAHLSAWTAELWERRFEIITQNIENLRNNKKLKNIVNT